MYCHLVTVEPFFVCKMIGCVHQTDLARELSILLVVTHTLVCHGVGRCVKKSCSSSSLDSWVKVDGQYYWAILPSQQMSDIIRHVADEDFVFPWKRHTSQCIVYSTIQLLLCKILFLLSYGQPNSPELVAIEYKIREATGVEEIKQWLVEVYQSSTTGLLKTITIF